MKEINEIIRAYSIAQQNHLQTALATVVHVEGSSYRQPGARMLITEEGALTGAISGGCLEGDALRKALHVMQQQNPVLVTYDTNDEDDAKLGLGLGCNGIIQVLIEPIIATDKENPIEYLKAATAQRHKSVLVTLFSLEDKKNKLQGSCLWLGPDSVYCRDNVMITEALITDAREAAAIGNSVFKSYLQPGIHMQGFVQVLEPAISLVIVGAGNDTLPLAQMATVLGWEITLADGRPQYAKKERFPAGCNVLLSKPENLLQQIKLDEQTAIVLMTHNYNYDLEMLRLLQNFNVLYIGMLGPAKKLERMLADLQANASMGNINWQQKLYSPAGLDIGAETPEEIALSILAEIKTVMNNRKGGFLKDRTGSIHTHSVKAWQASELYLNQ
jgi:xanthine/CO dehydrogenase XdhC/CoxF family maturation factor